jgi:hypothetical protein
MLKLTLTDEDGFILDQFDLARVGEEQTEESWDISHNLAASALIVELRDIIERLG